MTERVFQAIKLPQTVARDIPQLYLSKQSMYTNYLETAVVSVRLGNSNSVFFCILDK